MVDVMIKRLQLHIHNASGHEHRGQGIAQRAAALFAERVREHHQVAGGGSAHIDALAGPRVNLDLGGLSDGEAAGRIASAWFDAYRLHLKV